MAGTKNTAAAAPETAQNGQEIQEVTQDVQAQETAPDGPLEVAEPVCEAVGPEGPDDLPGHQDEDGAELDETEFIEYAVKGCKRLNLREEPNLNAPVVAELPYGVGVLGNSRPAENGWRQVFTGRLFGWVMDKFLEPLSLSEWEWPPLDVEKLPYAAD